MKVADYVAQFLAEQGVKDIFLLSGGGMMHLLDAVGKNRELHLICNLHEQACAICADSYGQFTGKLGVCMVTTGPGGTNALTGITASWLDSTPVLTISGQCKTSDFAGPRRVRQYGAQEVDIVSIVKPVTKYAVQITKPASIRYHLEKAVYLAQHGRKGPVWLDIPLDVQAAQVEPDALSGFSAREEGLEERTEDCSAAVDRIYELLNQAERPALLAGGGAVMAKAGSSLMELVHRLKVPVLTTWRAKEIFPDDDELHFGPAGIPAARYSNYILQNCDLLLVLGTRLNYGLTAYDERHFAFQAKKIMVDIDRAEMDKLDMEFEVKLQADCGAFLERMLSRKQELPSYGPWLAFCNDLKKRYPLSAERQPYDQEGLTDGYLLGETVSRLAPEETIWIGSSSGRTCGISHLAVHIKKGQRFISSMGLGSMGFTLPSAIACCIAGGRRLTVAFEGDGSLQHNIQELQLLTAYELPVKLFVLSNTGYASISMMQHNNFDDRLAACTPGTGLSFPSLEKVADTYGLAYYRIHDDSEVEPVARQVLADRRPVLCQVDSSLWFDEIPKSMTVVHPDGSLTSSKLEDLYPFLPEKETAGNMPDWRKPR